MTRRTCAPHRKDFRRGCPNRWGVERHCSGGAM